MAVLAMEHDDHLRATTEVKGSKYPSRLPPLPLHPRFPPTLPSTPPPHLHVVMRGQKSAQPEVSHAYLSDPPSHPGGAEDPGVRKIQTGQEIRRPQPLLVLYCSVVSSLSLQERKPRTPSVVRFYSLYICLFIVRYSEGFSTVLFNVVSHRFC